MLLNIIFAGKTRTFAKDAYFKQINAYIYVIYDNKDLQYTVPVFKDVRTNSVNVISIKIKRIHVVWSFVVSLYVHKKKK